MYLFRYGKSDSFYILKEASSLFISSYVDVYSSFDNVTFIGSKIELVAFMKSLLPVAVDAIPAVISAPLFSFSAEPVSTVP